MEYKKDYLEKLLVLIKAIDETNENDWFKERIIKMFLDNENSYSSNNAISEIHELCIKTVLKEQSRNFYKDFKLEDIKPVLIKDFMRMECFRRENNFDDFCLAAYQQIEAIVNNLLKNSIVIDYFRDNLYMPAFLRKDYKTNTTIKVGEKLGIFIFQTNQIDQLNAQASKPHSQWYFTQRYRAILYFYYFNKEVYNKADFETIYNLGNYLYQMRNTNHRESESSKYQSGVLEIIRLNDQLYYFKFLGLIADFVSQINKII